MKGLAQTGLLLIGLFTAFITHASPLEGRVVSINDGDTLTVLDAEHRQHKIRLAQIDAPEKRQAFGDKAKQSLSDLTFGKAVTVVVEDMDRYGRTVGRVMVDDKNANLEQVRRGMDWAYRQYMTDPAYCRFQKATA